MTSQSFCQTATKIQLDKKDSLIYMPKQLAVFLIQDVVKSDAYAEEIAVLNDNLKIKDKIIEQQDTIISIYKKKEKSYLTTISLHEETESEHTVQIQDLTHKLEKKRKALRFWEIVAVGAIGGMIGIHYNWKYGQ
jgi:hypothetical protein